MRITPALRDVFATKSGLLAFAITCLLLAASLYPLFIMVRTAFQTVGDPLEGTPSEIILARAGGGRFTMQNQPMVPGTWNRDSGFIPNGEAWEYDPTNDIQKSMLPTAAFQFGWEGDLRRFRRLRVEGAQNPNGWSIAWKDVNGTWAQQPLRLENNGTLLLNPDPRLTASAPGEQASLGFEATQITAVVLLPATDAPAHWTRVVLEPHRFTTVNFLNVWRGDNFSRYAFNSLLVALLVTIGSVITSLAAGYAFARSEWKFRQLFWVMLVGSMLIPSQVLLIPAFLIIQHFPLLGGNDILGQGGIGMLDSYSGLVIPNLVMPLGIFLVRQSLLSMPDACEEAAVIDGATIPRLLLHVIAPLLQPILATIALLAFLFNWNAFIFPLILIQSPEMRTLPVGLALYSARNEVDWVHLMAASTITALPIFILFLFFQKQLIAGLVHEGAKG